MIMTQSSTRIMAQLCKRVEKSWTIHDQLLQISPLPFNCHVINQCVISVKFPHRSTGNYRSTHAHCAYKPEIRLLRAVMRLLNACTTICS